MEENRWSDTLIMAAIVDDDERSRAYVRALLEDLASSLRIGLQCREYPSGMAFMLEPPQQLDLLLTDIDMPHASGLEVAAFARDRFGELLTVFVTAFEEYAVEGYSVRARRYLLKPVTRDRFRREVGPLLHEIADRRSDVVAVHLLDGTRVLRIRDIVCITTAPKKNIDVCTLAEKIRTRGSISEWETKLDNGAFFRCHSGVLVNLGAVKHVGSSELELLSGERLPLSKHRRRAFLEAFAAYMGAIL